MKKILIFVVIATIFLPSCQTIFQGAKKSIFLVDLPKDLEVSKNDQKLEISDLHCGSRDEGLTRYAYYYPGVRIKIKNNMVLTLKSKDKTEEFRIRTYVKTGDVIVSALGGVFITLGIGLIVDIVDGSFRRAKEQFIDVPALLNHTTSRTQKELQNFTMGNGKDVKK